MSEQSTRHTRRKGVLRRVPYHTSFPERPTFEQIKEAMYGTSYQDQLIVAKKLAKGDFHFGSRSYSTENLNEFVEILEIEGYRFGSRLGVVLLVEAIEVWQSQFFMVGLRHYQCGYAHSVGKSEKLKNCLIRHMKTDRFYALYAKSAALMVFLKESTPPSVALFEKGYTTPSTVRWPEVEVLLSIAFGYEECNVLGRRVWFRTWATKMIEGIESGRVVFPRGDDLFPDETRRRALVILSRFHKLTARPLQQD